MKSQQYIALLLLALLALCSSLSAQSSTRRTPANSSAEALTTRHEAASPSPQETPQPQGEAAAQPQALPTVHGDGTYGYLPVWTGTKTIGNSPVTIDPEGDTSQPRTAGGMVKAMLYYSGFNSGRIVSCFNSTLSGTAATSPPCGFSETKVGTGAYILDFGFEVDDRFFTLSNTNWFATSGFCTDWNGACNPTPNITPNQVEIFTFLPEPAYNTYADTKFYLFVY
jgi:hypothetical protein